MRARLNFATAILDRPWPVIGTSLEQITIIVLIACMGACSGNSTRDSSSVSSGASASAGGGTQANTSSSGGGDAGSGSKSTRVSTAGMTQLGSGGTTSAGGTRTSIGGGTGSSGGAKIGTGGNIASATGGMSTGGSIANATGGMSAGGTTAAAPGSLYNGVVWADTSGNPIQAHGGGIIKVGDYYYWFGENRNPNGTFYAVSCYRSADLVHWEFRKHVLTQDSAAELKPANIERPKVVYNASTKKYVMWMHWENGTNYGASRAAVASAEVIDDSYTYHGSARPLVDSGVVDHSTAGYQSRDCTLYVDTDSKAYFLSASNENYDLNLYLLKSDYLSIDSLAAVLFKGGHREAPAIWKRNNVYFLLTSGATGWDPNQAQYAISTSLTSGWSGWTNVSDSTTFHSQSTFVLPVSGTAGTNYVYLGDRWAGAWGGPVNDSTYVWIPIAFASNTAMSMSWSNTVTIDAQTGAVSGATNRFKFLNSSSGKAMSIENASTADHAAAVQSTYSKGKEQQWNLNYDSAGYFSIANVNSSLVLDVTSGSTADGASLIQYTSSGDGNQKWRIIAKGADTYQLVNKQSAKVVEVPASSTAEGATLDQRGYTSGATNQLWEMGLAN